MTNIFFDFNIALPVQIQKLIIMIRYIIFSALMFFGACLTYAQDVQFIYDYNGNRIHQEVLTVKSSISNEIGVNTVDTINRKIQMADNSFEIIIYPNPLQTVLNVTVNGELLPGKNKVELFTSSGVSIYSGEIQNSTNQLDFSKYSSGIYFLILTVGNESDSWKIVKQ
jgi:hypothetical protein